MTQAQTKPHSKPLRDLLRGAIEQRKASLRNNRCHLRNTEQIWVSISHAEKWMGHFPFAGMIVYGTGAWRIGITCAVLCRVTQRIASPSWLAQH